MSVYDRIVEKPTQNKRRN